MALTISNRGRRKLRRQMNKMFKGLGGYSAQVGVHQGRIAYKYKNERSGRVESALPGGSTTDLIDGRMARYDKAGKKIWENFRPDGSSRKTRWWDNLQILFRGLVKTKRNPIFSTMAEIKNIRLIWLRAANRSLRGRGNQAALALGARLVSRKLLINFRSHMAKGLTTGGKSAKAVSAVVVKSKVYRATHGNINYRRGGKKSIARKNGYGVDTGQLWDAFYIDVKKLPKSG
jgi:hypothetical protein